MLLLWSQWRCLPILKAKGGDEDENEIGQEAARRLRKAAEAAAAARKRGRRRQRCPRTRRGAVRSRGVDVREQRGLAAAHQGDERVHRRGLPSGACLQRKRERPPCN